MIKIDQEKRLHAESEARAFAERAKQDNRLAAIESKLDQLLVLMNKKGK